jgi:hypothetical protein
MGQVVKFYPANAADDIDNVLEQSIGEFNQAVIIGWDKNGYLDVRSDTTLTGSDVLWLIEVFKQKLLNGDYSVGEDEG